MEADRGQADKATVLSVGVHTSRCAGPDPDLYAQTHNIRTDSYLSNSRSHPGVWFWGVKQ